MDKKDVNELFQRLNNLEQMLSSIVQTPKQKKKEEPTSPGFQWLPLKDALKLLGKSKKTWDRYLHQEFKHKKFGVHTWVYKPSIDSWFMDNAIN